MNVEGIGSLADDATLASLASSANAPSSPAATGNDMAAGAGTAEAAPGDDGAAAVAASAAQAAAAQVEWAARGHQASGLRSGVEGLVLDGLVPTCTPAVDPRQALLDEPLPSRDEVEHMSKDASIALLEKLRARQQARVDLQNEATSGLPLGLATPEEADEATLAALAADRIDTLSRGAQARPRDGAGAPSDLDGVVIAEVSGSPIGPDGDTIGAPPTNAQLVTTFGAAVRAGDHKKMGEVLAQAPAEVLPQLERQLPAGHRIEDVLGNLRKADRAAYTKAIDGLTMQAADRGPGLAAKRALGQHMNTTPGAWKDYVDRYIRPPGRSGRTQAERSQAVIALHGAGHHAEYTVAALVRHGDPASPQFAADLERFPPAYVDQAAKPLLREMAARAHLHGDKEAAAIADAAAIALYRAGTREGQDIGIDHILHSAAERAEGAGRASAAVDADMHEVKARLAELNAFKELHATLEKEGDPVLTAQGKADLDEDIALQTAKLERLQGKKDKLAEQSLRQLDDPEFQAMLATRSPDEQAVLLAPMMDNIRGTKHADALYDRHVAPAIAGKPSVLADVFSSTSKARTLALTIVTNLAPQLAARGHGAFSQAMQKVLGKTAEELTALEGAISKLNSAPKGSAEAAAAAKEVQKLAGAGLTVNAVNAAFGGFALMMSLKKMAENPDLKSRLGVAKDTASLTKEVLSLFARDPALAEYAKWLGGAGKGASAIAGALTASVGAMNMRDAIDQLDPGSAIGSYLEAAGGVLAMGGTVIPPLALAGTLVGLSGWIVKATFGDSDEEQAMKSWAQKNGYRQR